MLELHWKYLYLTVKYIPNIVHEREMEIGNKFYEKTMMKVLSTDHFQQIHTLLLIEKAKHCHVVSAKIYRIFLISCLSVLCNALFEQCDRTIIR